MLEYNGELFDCLDSECDAICIATNGYVKKNGLAAVGRGCAKQMDDYSDGFFAKRLARELERHGNRTQKVMYDETNDTHVLAFPTKVTSLAFANNNDVVYHMKDKYQYGDLVPGCFARSELRLILISAHQLVAMADIFNWKQVALPRPGCGNGNLIWEEVAPALSEILDDRFVICHNGR